MLTDLHCHILPGIDDGAKDREMSLAMLDMMNGAISFRGVSS